MAITFLETKKREKNLILIFGIILALIVIVISYGFFFNPEIPAPSAVSFPGISQSFKKIEINWEMLENPKLKEFEPFQETPQFTGKTGRSNPFLPVGSVSPSI